ncbi:hypothetical protein Focb16_v006077 [Fusarium oxysporum f. sp. cubense]|nr:hypothetical protein Focb16_v006077 [Fusarium oxysporum f. sp. cubense]
MSGCTDNREIKFLARYEEPGETRFIEPGESFCVCEELSPEAGTASGEMYTQDIRLQLVIYPKTLQPPQPEPGSLAPLQQDTVSDILNTDVSGELKKKKECYMERNGRRQRINRRKALKAAYTGKKFHKYNRANGPSRLQGDSGVTMRQKTLDKDFRKYRNKK